MKYNPPPGQIRVSLAVKFIVGISLILVVALGISFYLISERQDTLIMSQAEGDARMLFNQIVITRSWIADHGGIFVQRMPGMSPSPYLDDPELVDIQGQRFMRKSPAMVTKDLSTYAKDRGLFWFHITSLRLTNPENEPDAFERHALTDFEKGVIKERFSIESIDNSNYLRYIAPLHIEEGCMQCHAHQGYRIGEVRGAISVMIPVDKTLALVKKNRESMFISAAAIILTLGVAIFFMMQTLVLAPMKELTRSIKDFEGGNYSPKEIFQTGDELEDLSRSFSEMAATLTSYHAALNERISDATRDIEDANLRLKEANKLLNEANLRKSDFIARASHEIRTPLTSIKGAMDYLAARFADLPPPLLGDAEAEIKSFLSVIRNNTERIIRLVNDMLDLERIESGVSDFQMSPMDLADVIHETLADFRPASYEKNLTLSQDIAPSLTVRGDADRLKQVFMNLLSNAVKFSGSGGVITVRAYREGSYVLAEITDQGQGILPQDQERIFEKFFRKGPREGAGLGLAICRTIIESHGGSIGVVSDGVKGSSFCVRLPCAGA